MAARATVSACAMLACATIAFGGCSGATIVRSSVDPVAQAAEVSERLPGYQVKLSSQVSGLESSEAVEATASGFFDGHGKRGVLTVHAGATTEEAQYAGLVEYTRVQGAKLAAIAHGRTWVEVNLRELGAALGIDYSALGSGGGATDPASELSDLRASSGEVLRIGSEDVDGVPTTHYRATIDWTKYIDIASPPQRANARASVAAIERISGSSTQPVDVWVDAEHHVRRTEETIHECVPGVSGKISIRLRIDLSNFGVQRIPALPSSANVTDITPTIAKQFEHVKLGCS